MMDFFLIVFIFLQASAATIYQMDPSHVQELKLEYHMQDLELFPGDEINLDLPQNFTKRPLDFAYITHKQDPKKERECKSHWDGAKVRDCLPAYTSFEVLDSNTANSDEEWRYWGGAGSGPFNSKFAEIRSHQGETDNLYEWRKKGHRSVKTKSKSRDALIPLRFRVRSVGPDSLILQDVVIKFLPPPPTSYEEVIFSPGLRFGDYETASGRSYPGHSSVGDYGSSLALTRRKVPSHPQVPKNWILRKGQILIPLQAGKRFLFLDVAAGDMKRVPTGQNPEAYRGGAKITVKLNDILLADAENIGTNGVLRFTPGDLKTTGHSSQNYLLMTVPDGTAQIMGIRLGYDEN